jgi:hypothetical protein
LPDGGIAFSAQHPGFAAPQEIALTITTKDPKPARSATVIGLLRRFCALSSGHLIHECIKAPKGLSFPLGKRSKRLIRDSQISHW